MEAKTPKPTPVSSGNWRRRLWYAGLAVAYLAAAAPLAYLSRDAICPDAVAYFQTARHWAAGRLDLAVNGWFSPLLSWLLVPAVWVGAEPLHVARALGVLYGLLFAAGVVRLARALGGGRFAVWAFAAALVLSLRTVFAEVTPDFLMTAGLTWYFALAAEMIRSFSIRKAVLAGLIAAACYLAKAYALPVVLVHLPLTFAAGWLANRKGTGLAKIAAPPAIGLGVFILCVAPWLAAISARFGRFTTNTSATLASRSWPAGVPMAGAYPHYALQRPREGRIAAWENPAEAKGQWPTWYGPGGKGWTWDNQLTAVAYNLKWTFLGGRRGPGQEYVPGHMAKADILLTLVIGWAAATGLGLFSRQPARQRVLWIWGSLTAGIYLGGYVLLYFYERFTWGAWGILIALAASVLAHVAGGAKAAPQSPATGRKKDKPSLPAGGSSSGGRTASLILAVVVIASFGYRLVERVRKEADDPASESRMGVWIRSAAMDSPLKGRGAPVVSNDWHKGLYFTYWTGSVYLGQWPRQETRGDDPGRELRPFSPVNVVVYENAGVPALEKVLTNYPGFAVGRVTPESSSRWRLVEMTYTGAAPGVAAAGGHR